MVMSYFVKKSGEGLGRPPPVQTPMVWRGILRTGEGLLCMDVLKLWKDGRMDIWWNKAISGVETS